MDMCPCCTHLSARLCAGGPAGAAGAVCLRGHICSRAGRGGVQCEAIVQQSPISPARLK